MATQPAAILRLAPELLREILDHIEDDPEKLVNLDRRAYLSQESFKQPSPPAPDRSEIIANFRLTCRKFSEIGAVHQFARVTTRFSEEGFERLQGIAEDTRIAKHVIKFSYMVPYFYDAHATRQDIHGTLSRAIQNDTGRSRERVREILQSLEGDLGPMDVKHFVKKIKDQQEIIKSGKDAKVLKIAMAAFSSLQHIQILRVQDSRDERLMNHLRDHQELARHFELDWTPACSHSTKTIGEALLNSHSPASRFSSPMLSPQSAEVLAEMVPAELRSLLERLTSLEIHFDDGVDLDNKMTRLSGLFKTVFTAASNIEAIHLGFPSHRPLNLRLEDIFHNVRWKRLKAFGIQAWKLDADEVIALADRHRETLRGLRLRDVQLREGSRWNSVLKYLHDEMPWLNWVSLRRIGYAKQFDQQWAAAGVEVPDDPPGGGSESDSDDEVPDTDAPDNPDSDVEDLDHHSENDNHASDAEDEEDDDSSSDNTYSDDDEHGPSAHEMDFPQLSPSTPRSAPWCTCNGNDSYCYSIEDLNDDGVVVSNATRKLWEKWVVKRCAEHGKVRR